MSNLPILKTDRTFDWDAIKTPSSLANASSLQQSDWTDNIFETKWAEPAIKELPPIMTPADAVNLAMYFWATYYGMEKPTSAEFYSIYLQLFLQVKVKGETLLSSITPSSTKNKIAKSTLKTHVTTYKNDISLVDKITGTTSRTTTVEADTFYTYLLTLSKSTDHDDTTLLLNISGFMAFTCLRLTKKDPSTFNQHVVDRINITFDNIFGTPLGEKATPPDQSFYSLYSMIMPTDSHNSRMLLALTVKSIITTQSEGIKGFCRSTCLLTLSDNGLGILCWAQKGANSLSLPLKEYLKYFANLNMIDTIELIIDFSVKYSEQLTWNWSRLFDQSAFCKYATSQSPKFCLVGAFLAISDPVIVKEMLQFQRFSNMFDSAYTISNAIKQLVNKAEMSVVYTEEAYKLSVHLQQTALSKVPKGLTLPKIQTQTTPRPPTINSNPPSPTGSSEYEWSNAGSV